MGVIPGAMLTVTKLAPMGDPIQIKIHGYELTLRLADAHSIAVEQAECPKTHEDGSKRKKKPIHPGLGETGKFHPKGSGDPLPDDTVLTFALVGNQNSDSFQSAYGL